MKKKTFNAQRSTFNVQRRDAFTLIELLIVISIIVILMGLLFPAFRGAQDQAKKVQAKNDLIQIVTAITQYYTEYGRYPPVAGDDTPITNNKDLFDILRGSGGDEAANPRKIVFITVPDVKDTTNPRSGIGTDGQFYDPWGTPYKIAIDAAYDGEMNNPYGAGGNAGPAELRQTVIAWSLGKNKSQDSDVKAGDDVISWQ